MQSPQLENIGFQEAPVALMMLTDRRVLRVNAEFEQLLGWARADLEGRSVRLLYPSGREFEDTGSRWLRRMVESPRHEDERFMRRKDGSVIWTRVRGRSLTPERPFHMTLWSLVAIRDPAPLPETLTARERGVAGHIVQGRSSREIAGILGISSRTVDVHRAAILRKFGLRKTAELVAHLLR